MKSIWIINHYATNMAKNKNGRHYNFAKLLQEKGYDVKVIAASTFHNSKDSFTIPEKSRFIVDQSSGVPFIFIKTPQYSSNGFDRIKNMYKFYRNLIRSSKTLVKEHGNPDIIYASSPHPLTLIAGNKLSKKYNAKSICEVRDLWPEAIFAFSKLKEKSLIGRLLLNREKWIYKKADALIFTKEGDTDYIKERRWDKNSGGSINLEKAHYINNGVDLASFKAFSKTNKVSDVDLENNAFNAVYVGAIRPVNNLEKLVSAAEHLDDSSIQILIYGDGSEREILEKLVKEKGLTNIQFKGRVDKNNIPYILKHSSLNLLNYSQNEYNWTRGNSSNKLFEYMASAKPILATIKMGYSIIDKYQCGYEIHDATGKEIADKITSIKNLPNHELEKLGNNAYEGAKDFDFLKLTEQLENVIHSVEQQRS